MGNMAWLSYPLQLWQVPLTISLTLTSLKTSGKWLDVRINDLTGQKDWKQSFFTKRFSLNFTGNRVCLKLPGHPCVPSCRWQDLNNYESCDCGTVTLGLWLWRRDTHFPNRSSCESASLLLRILAITLRWFICPSCSYDPAPWLFRFHESLLFSLPPSLSFSLPLSSVRNHLKHVREKEITKSTRLLSLFFSLQECGVRTCCLW